MYIFCSYKTLLKKKEVFFSFCQEEISNKKEGFKNDTIYDTESSCAFKCVFIDIH